MGVEQQIENMFDVEDPEQAGKLAITCIAVMIAVSIIFYALSILCFAGEAICCLVSCCKCIKNGCACCARCFKSSDEKEGEEGEEGASSSSKPSANTTNVGQLMSLIIMIISILLALVWEFYFADGMDNSAGTSKAWTQSCNENRSDYDQCIKFQAAYRVSFVVTFFFFIMSIISKIRPDYHDKGWDVKILAFVLLIVAVTFIPSKMFDQHGYVWVARIGAFIFLILQQIILIDSAYSLNEFLVEKGYAVGSQEGEWNIWLVLCLMLSVVLIATAITGIVLLFVYYTGCDNSNTFISFTLIGIVLFTVLQLFFTKPDENSQGHNLLTTAVVAAYVVYLCFVAVSANPTESCNPMYSEKQNVTALVMGLVITFISITGTVYFSSQSMTGLVGSTQQPVKSPDLEQVLTGETATSGTAERPSLTRQVTGGLDASDQYWKFNAVMALISCYWCCVLTDWGNPGGGASAASPTAGDTAMWMNISASWVCMLLYIWTLAAPLLFPDRDFS